MRINSCTKIWFCSTNQKMKTLNSIQTLNGCASGYPTHMSVCVVHDIRQRVFRIQNIWRVIGRNGRSQFYIIQVEKVTNERNFLIFRAARCCTFMRMMWREKRKKLVAFSLGAPKQDPRGSLWIKREKEKKINSTLVFKLVFFGSIFFCKGRILHVSEEPEDLAQSRVLIKNLKKLYRTPPAPPWMLHLKRFAFNRPLGQI